MDRADLSSCTWTASARWPSFEPTSSDELGEFVRVPRPTSRPFIRSAAKPASASVASRARGRAVISPG